MSKGLKLTLMTVAVAMMAAQVMAMAPTIGNIPSPIVSDIENVTTPANYFVYPDAFKLSDYVTDDSSSSTSIIWTYEITGTPKYKINGVPPIDRGAGDDPATPPAGKVINTQVLGGEHNPDNNVATLTIRNIHLTPNLNEQGLDPSGSNLIETEAQLVTLYASDGEQATPKDVWFYSDHQGDRLSTGWTNVFTGTFTGTLQGFVYSLVGGTATSSTSSGTAICIQVPLTGNNFAQWTGPYGMLNLVKNSVYRIRAKMVGSQASGGGSNVPFWDLTINNFTTVGGFHGRNLYGFNYFVLDNAGRANAVTTTPTDFEFWWCPSPVSLTNWNNSTSGQGLFTTGMAADKDSFLEFRVLDDNTNGGITADSDLGSLCITDLVIDRADIASMSVISTPLNYTRLINGSGGNTRVSSASEYTAAYSGGSTSALTLTPTTAGQTKALAQVDPDDGTNASNPGDPATLPDNYPVPMQPKKLYLISMGVSVPDSASQTNQQDMFWVGADTPTNELICLTWVSGQNGAVAMPTTTVQDYKCLFYSNYSTNQSGAAYSAFRPRFMVGNDPALAATTNSGSIRLHSMKVQEVQVN